MIKTINCGNLIEIKGTSTNRVSYSRNLNIALLNCQSVKNKDQLITDYMYDEKIDICVLTETWLTKQDKHWIETLNLNNENLSMDISNQLYGRDGGLGLVTKTSLITQKLREQHMKTFQVAKWRVKTKSESLLVIMIYHPPYSTTSQTTNSAFLDEFTEWITAYLAHEKNIFITGDFNIHINNSGTDNASTSLETLKDMSLQQHVNFDTQKKGNTLNLVLTESYSGIIIKSCTQGSFLSDHCVVLCQIFIEREDIETKSVTYRNLKDLDQQAFEVEIRTEYPDDQKLEELIRNF